METRKKKKSPQKVSDKDMKFEIDGKMPIVKDSSRCEKVKFYEFLIRIQDFRFKIQKKEIRGSIK